jgi:hypothetical protein
MIQWIKSFFSAKKEDEVIIWKLRHYCCVYNVTKNGVVQLDGTTSINIHVEDKNAIIALFHKYYPNKRIVFLDIFKAIEILR